MDPIEKQSSGIERVRKREEARLIKLAQKAGLFDWRMSSADLEALLRDGLKSLDPRQQSQLSRLETAMAVAKKKQSEYERRLDARRKILLGSFLIAQMQHKPVLKADLIPELEQFLDQHKDPNVAMRNKELLKEWLDGEALSGESNPKKEK